MNAHEMAVEAVAMVAPEARKGLTVNVRGNMIAIQLVRDVFESEAFANYTEIVNRTWDALSAIKGARFNAHRAGGVELMVAPGRSNARKELYMTTFEVFTVAEVEASAA